MIYADYSATTPLDPRVFEKMSPYFVDNFYNISSLYPMARKVREDVETAREIIANSICAKANEIVFTSGGTECDNLALIGVATHKDNHKRHIITSSIEHHAILESCTFLEENGFRVTYLPVDETGRVSPDTLKNAICDDTFLVSIMWVNNELGTIQNIFELAKITHENGAYFHTDGVQALTTQDVDVNKLGVDLMSMSSHKIYGPKGCGALYVKNGTKLGKTMFGGQQENYLRGGTENVTAIIGMGEAMRLLQTEKKSHLENMSRWRSQLIKFFSKFEDIRINSPIDGASSILNIAFKDVEAEGMLFWLAKSGIAISMGSACNSKSIEPSHVIQAIKVPKEYERGALRISFGRGLDDEQVKELAEKIIEIVGKVKQ